MNNLNQYIQEKLKINSKSKIKNLEFFTDFIIEFLYGDDDNVDNEIINIINNFVKENKKSKLVINSTIDELYSYGFDGDELDRYMKMKDIELILDHSSVFHNYVYKILGETLYSDKYTFVHIYLSKDKTTLINKFRNKYILFKFK